ncbi:phosphodiesterase [Aminipila terrae]|uniref:Phosphoesterase n=1 Tax=Aminipila terrae TaxID=2697030 RepID=A0A6P1MJM1_9FIRM|nr:phosphodiesterase [Aminipila terrae]QHI72834.1 phosphodiesterase [Aminipila terrae]
MKLMIASDIHGSSYYCNKMIEAYKEEEAEKLLLLGDILYHGPRNDLPKDYDPKKVIKMLNSISREILCVRGNCEAEVDQMVLDFPVLADYCIIYLGSRMMFATHGHKLNPENLPPLNKGDILLNGHTHVPKCVGYGEAGQIDFIYMNPGSVSMPKENSPQSYIIVDNNKFTWKDFEGNAYLEYNIR